jgi:DNA-binding IclR family transcriptional regulator
MRPAIYKESRMLEKNIAIIRVLAGHTFSGLSNGEIAKAIEDTPQNVTRYLANLSKLGVVQETKVPKQWRLGPMMVQIALAHSANMQRVENELQEIKQRYSRKD